MLTRLSPFSVVVGSLISLVWLSALVVNRPPSGLNSNERLLLRTPVAAWPVWTVALLKTQWVWLFTGLIALLWFGLGLHHWAIGGAMSLTLGLYPAFRALGYHARINRDWHVLSVTVVAACLPFLSLVSPLLLWPALPVSLWLVLKLWHTFWKNECH